MLSHSYHIIHLKKRIKQKKSILLEANKKTEIQYNNLITMPLVASLQWDGNSCSWCIFLSKIVIIWLLSANHSIIRKQKCKYLLGINHFTIQTQISLSNFVLKNTIHPNLLYRRKNLVVHNHTYMHNTNYSKAESIKLSLVH